MSGEPTPEQVALSRTEEKRRMPVHSRLVKMDGEWVGWEFTARMNPKVKVIDGLLSAENDQARFGQVVEALSQVLVSWNFVDEEGESMPPPSSDSVRELPTDLLGEVANKYIEVLSQVPPKSTNQ